MYMLIEIFIFRVADTARTNENLQHIMPLLRNTGPPKYLTPAVLVPKTLIIPNTPVSA
jgi:hypothetical protein